MDARDIIRQARKERVKQFSKAMQDLSQRYGLILRPGFTPVEDSNFIRPILNIEDMPGWEGPPTPREDKREAITSESSD